MNWSESTMVRAQRTGETCGFCGRPFEDGEPLYVGRWGRWDPLAGTRYFRFVICWECHGEHDSVEDALADLEFGSNPNDNGNPYHSDCDVCRRPLAGPIRSPEFDGGLRWVCSTRCYDRFYYRRRRRDGRRSRLRDMAPLRICQRDGCDNYLDVVTRADAKFCSTRCRVAHHRERREDAADPSSVLGDKRANRAKPTLRACREGDRGG